MRLTAGLLLPALMWSLSLTAKATDDPGIELGPGEQLTDILSIDRPGETWIAVDGGMLRPLPSLSGFEPGSHQLLLVTRDVDGEVADSQWVRINVIDAMASGRDAYPANYLIDNRPPRLEPLDPPFIRPEDALPVVVSDESGILSVTFELNGEDHDVSTPPEPWSVGKHSVVVTAHDRAGNVAELRLGFEVDDQPPSVTIVPLERVIESGSGLVVRGTGELQVTADDDLSGVVSLIYRVADGRWRGVREVVEVEDNVGWIEFKAEDAAGNETVVRREVSQ